MSSCREKISSIFCKPLISILESPFKNDKLACSEYPDKMLKKSMSHVFEISDTQTACADPEEGTGGPDPL